MDENKKIDLADLAWYQSTQGPAISATLKAVIGLVLPLLKTSLGFEIGGPVVDGLIDAALILGFGIWALISNIKARRTFVGALQDMQHEIIRLGGLPK